MTDARILRGDVVRFCRLHGALGLPLYSAVLCDAPYGLSFMGKSWDSIEGIAFDPDTWRAIADCLLPGAYLFVFAGNLNDDLISVAMRRAGLVKQHKSLAWANGSSLPKTSRIDTRIDARNEVNDEMMRRIALVGSVVAEYRKRKDMTRSEVSAAVVGTPSGACWNWEHHQMPSVDMWPKIKQVLDIPDKYDVFILGDRAQFIEAEREVVGHESKSSSPLAGNHNGVWTDGASDDYDITAPATPLAQTWAGHRYGAQALRNLVESILIFRKPYEGKAYESIVRYGSGALNIEESRIGTGEEDTRRSSKGGENGLLGTSTFKIRERRADDNPKVGGRHPANFYIQHSEKCIPRGTKRVRGSATSHSSKSSGGDGIYGERGGYEKHDGYADADGTEEVAAWECARDDQGRYLCPVALLDEQAGVSKSSGNRRGEISETSTARSWANQSIKGIAHIDYNDTGGPSRFVVCADWQHEAFERTARRIPDDTGHAIEDANAVRYQSKPSKVQRDAGLRGHFPCSECGEYNTTTHMVAVGDKQESRPCRRSIHPTRKPIELMKYLCTLLAPPDAYAPRRLFVPFCGEGSEVSGAILSGEWEQIVGVDSECAYVDRARVSVVFWQDAMKYGQTDPAVILANAPPEANEAGDRQLDLFGKG